MLEHMICPNNIFNLLRVYVSRVTDRVPFLVLSKGVSKRKMVKVSVFMVDIDK